MIAAHGREGESPPNLLTLPPVPKCKNFFFFFFI